MHKYPDIGVDQGVTPWAEDSVWKRDKVFADRCTLGVLYSALLQRFSHSSEPVGCPLKVAPIPSDLSDTLVVGQHAVIGDGLEEVELRTPLLSWSEMWNKVLKTHVITAPQLPMSLIQPLQVQQWERDESIGRLLVPRRVRQW